MAQKRTIDDWALGKLFDVSVITGYVDSQRITAMWVGWCQGRIWITRGSKAAEEVLVLGRPVFSVPRRGDDSHLNPYPAGVTDPATAARILVQSRGHEAALRLCELNIKDLGQDLEGRTHWKQIKAAIEALSRHTSAPGYPLTIDTLGKLIDGGYSLAAYCDRCVEPRGLVDLEALVAKLGRDHSSSRDALRPHLPCPKCTERMSFTLHPPSQPTAAGAHSLG